MRRGRLKWLGGGEPSGIMESSNAVMVGRPRRGVAGIGDSLGIPRNRARSGRSELGGGKARMKVSVVPIRARRNARLRMPLLDRPMSNWLAWQAGGFFLAGGNGPRFPPARMGR